MPPPGVIPENSPQTEQPDGPVRLLSAGPYHILAASSPSDERTRVLKRTRYLSCLLLELAGGRPFFLSSTVRDENDQLAVALTNPDLIRDGQVQVALGTLHLSLKKFLWQGTCYQQLRVKNHALVQVDTSLTLHFAADFADIFEVRGMKRTARGAGPLPGSLCPAGLVGGFRLPSPAGLPGPEDPWPRSPDQLHPAPAAGLARRAAHSQPGSGRRDGRSGPGPPRERRERRRAAA